MIIYNNTGYKLAQVQEKPFKLEKEIQNIFENNLNNLSSINKFK